MQSTVKFTHRLAANKFFRKNPQKNNFYTTKNALHTFQTNLSSNLFPTLQIK